MKRLFHRSQRHKSECGATNRQLLHDDPRDSGWSPQRDIKAIFSHIHEHIVMYHARLNRHTPWRHWTFTISYNSKLRRWRHYIHTSEWLTRNTAREGHA